MFPWEKKGYHMNANLSSFQTSSHRVQTIIFDVGLQEWLGLLLHQLIALLMPDTTNSLKEL